jgi:hypothetical protein
LVVEIAPPLSMMEPIIGDYGQALNSSKIAIWSLTGRNYVTGLVVHIRKYRKSDTLSAAFFATEYRYIRG